MAPTTRERLITELERGLHRPPIAAHERARVPLRGARSPPRTAPPTPAYPLQRPRVERPHRRDTPPVPTPPPAGLLAVPGAVTKQSIDGCKVALRLIVDALKTLISLVPERAGVVTSGPAAPQPPSPSPCPPPPAASAGLSRRF